jgi:hypothetical protein
MALPEFVRELRPHFSFWLLEKALGAIVIAALLAAVEYAQHHVDAVAIVVVFVSALVALVWIDRKKQVFNQPTVVPSSFGTRTPVEKAVLDRAWVQWAAIADEYERLDYDNRSNNSTRFPFNRASWPGFGEPWSFVNATLYRLNDKVATLRSETEAIFEAFGWTVSEMPNTNDAVVMVEFLRQVRELQTYLANKRGESQ